MTPVRPETMVHTYGTLPAGVSRGFGPKSSVVKKFGFGVGGKCDHDMQS